MCSKGLFKRLVPFFLTFAVGLFIASFFVNISGPRFGFGNRARRFHEMQQLRIERDQLRDEVEALRTENRHANCKRSVDLETGKETYSLMPLDVPPPPARPVRLHKVTVK